jgi:hypothetical protein
MPGVSLTGRVQKSVRCCFHDDRTASMSINTEKGVWKCHAGCGEGGILDFEQKFSSCDRETAQDNVQQILGDELFTRSTKKRPDAIYKYVDAAGKPVAEKLRYNTGEGKKFFRWRQSDGNGGYRYRLTEGLEKPLYRLHELIRSNACVVTEGEKDADNVAAAIKEPHFSATTSPDGASRRGEKIKWLPSYSPYFAGKFVAILPDNDEAGRYYAEFVASAIAPYAASVKMVPLPDLPEHGDVSDYLKTHNGADLLQEIKRAPQWRPAQVPEWRGIFHSIDEFENAPPLSFAIDQFLQADGITLIGGLSGHGKTLVMLAMTRSLLTGEALFDWFEVPRTAERVLYLIPESSIAAFWSRIKLFRLEEHIRTDRLLVRTLSHPVQAGLNDPRILQAAQGADVFLDTAVRFMDGNENDVENSRNFAKDLFQLLAAGARTISGAHHSAKSADGVDRMTLENTLRGSGDLGAMVACAWAIRQVDAESNRIYVSNLKAREFAACCPFVLEGRPHLNECGTFKMVEEPGQTGPLRKYLDAEREKDKSRAGRPVTPAKDEKVQEAVRLRAEGKSLREMEQMIKVGKSTIDRWLFEYDASQNMSQRDRLKDNAEPRTEVGGEASPKDFPTSGLGG